MAIFQQSDPPPARNYEIERFKRHCVTLDEIKKAVSQLPSAANTSRTPLEETCATSSVRKKAGLTSVLPIVELSPGFTKTSLHSDQDVNNINGISTTPDLSMLANKNGEIPKSRKSAYTPLDYHDGKTVPPHLNTQIRLLSFVSWDTVTFETFSLKDCPSYVPISYAWGDRNDNGSFKIQWEYQSHGRTYYESSRITCSSTLQGLLHSLYLYSHPANRTEVESVGGLTPTKYYWIDAICINQGDSIEKDHQISIMSLIYQLGTRLHIHLGLDDGALGLGLRTIQIMSDCVKKNITTLPDWVTTVDILAMRQFFHKDWFHRSWIIQEYGLCKKAYVMCGTSIFDCSDLCRANIEQPAFSVEKDKIYSLVSLSSDFRLTANLAERAENCLLVHNDLPLGNLIWDIIRQWNKQDCTLDFLQFISSPERRGMIEFDHVDTNSQRYITMEGPSWMPDLTVKTSMHTLQGHENGYAAAALYHDDNKMAVKRRNSRDQSSKGVDLALELVKYNACGDFNKAKLKTAITTYNKGALYGHRMLYNLALSVRAIFLCSVDVMGQTEHSNEGPDIWNVDRKRRAAIKYMRGINLLTEHMKLFSIGHPNTVYFNGDHMKDVLTSCYTAGHHKAGDPSVWMPYIREVFDDYDRNIASVHGISEGNRDAVERIYNEHRALSKRGRDSFTDLWWPVLQGRRIFRSVGDVPISGVDFLCGLCPGGTGDNPATKFGDSVVIIAGCSIPMVVRHNPQKGGWQVIGECYVHGCMDGSMAQESRFVDITLV